MSESGERETETTAGPTSTETGDAPSGPVSDEPRSEAKPPDSSTDPSWDEVTPPRHNPATSSDAMQWSASEVTVVKAPALPEPPETSGPLLPPLVQEAEVHGETSGTMAVMRGRFRSTTPHHRTTPAALAGTHAGIELGRPVFAVGIIGVLAAIGAWFFVGSSAAIGVAVGASTATLNLWAFTRIGTAFLSRRGVRASWGLLAGFKLLALFGTVALVLRTGTADPVSFLIGYLALPVGIVASQLLGLQPDFEEH